MKALIDQFISSSSKYCILSSEFAGLYSSFLLRLCYSHSIVTLFICCIICIVRQFKIGTFVISISL